jgi:hypothetical protein
MSDTTPVSMRVTERTLEDIEYLQETLDSRNRTEAVVEAIKLARLLVEERQKGNELELKTPSGESKIVVMPGLNRLNHSNGKR